MMANLSDGRAKMYVLSRALRIRRERSALFSSGEYVPITTVGARADQVFSFLRQRENDCVLEVVPRLIASLLHAPIGPQAWEDTLLQMPEAFENSARRNVFTGEEANSSHGHLQLRSC